MVSNIVLFVTFVVIFFPLDFIWLSTVGRHFYYKELAGILLPKPRLAVAGAFYVAYLVGLVVLVGSPAAGDLSKAFWLGAVFGFVCYGTLDLTNLATVRGFTLRYVVVDVAWGTVLTAVTAVGGTWLTGLVG